MALWAVAVVCSSAAPPQLQLRQLNPLLALALNLLDEASPQALSNTLWAAATISLSAIQDATPGDQWPPRDWLARFEAHATCNLGAHSALGLYNLLWGLAKLRWTPSDAFLSAACDAVAARAAEASPQAASGAIWALACLKADLGAAFFAAWHAATRAAVAASWGPADLANALWAHAVLGVRPPPDWVGAALGRAAAIMPSLGQLELTTVLWACARLRLPPPHPWMHQWLDAYERCALGAPLAPTLPCAAYSLALLRFRPPLAWAGRLVEEAALQMECMGPQQLANLIWALARLRLTPNAAWMGRFMRQVGGLCPGAGGGWELHV